MDEETKNMFPLRILFVLSVVWLALTLAAPLLVASRYSVLKYIGTAIYFFMDPVCHQLPQRSLFIAGLPMPVCGRCFFIYFGGTITVGVTVLRGKLFAWPPKIYWVLFSAITAEFIVFKWFFHTEWTYLRYAGGFLLGILLFRLLLEALMYKGNKGIVVK